MKNTINKIIVLLLIITFTFILSYGFFNYVKIANENEIIVGNIFLHYDTSNTLLLVDTQPRSELDPNMYIEFSINGINEYKLKDIWYAIDLLYGDIPENKKEEERIKDEFLRFTLMKKIDNGEFETIFDNKRFPNIDELRMYVETIPKETLNEISHTYRLYIWISDEIKIGNTLDSDYQIEQWNNLFASIKIKVVGDFNEKENHDFIRVNFDANGGEVTPSFRYYSNEDTFGILPVPIKNGYVFEGWELNGNLIEENDKVISYIGNEIEDSFGIEIKTNEMYKYIGNKVFNGTSDYIDTGIYLFNSNNWQKNFYMEFEKVTDNSTLNDSTLMSSKNESKSPWPGLDFRHKNSKITLHSKATKNSSSAKDFSNLSNNIKKVKFLRINNILYYSFDSDTFTEMLDFNGFSLFFEVPVTFGVGLTGPNGIPRDDRYFKGTLANMLVEFISDEATISNYQDFIHSSFKLANNTYYNDITLRAKWQINSMSTLPGFITNKKREIKKIVFQKENDIDLARYNYLDDNLKNDIASTGSVKAWLEQDNDDNLYTLYIESNGKTFLTTGQSLFSGFNKLKEIDFANIDTSLVKNMAGMFNGCNSLLNIDVSNFDTSQVTQMQNMFTDCSNLTILNLINFDTSNVNHMGSMFKGCRNLINLNISSFNTSQVTKVDTMFQDCSKLTSLDVSNFDTSQVIQMYNMFKGCNNLTSIDVSSFNTSNVTNMQSMFANCSKLKNIYASILFVLKPEVNGEAMFDGCISLVGEALNTRYSYDKSKIDKTYATLATDTQEGYLTDISLKTSV